MSTDPVQDPGFYDGLPVGRDPARLVMAQALRAMVAAKNALRTGRHILDAEELLSEAIRDTAAVLIVPQRERRRARVPSGRMTWTNRVTWREAGRRLAVGLLLVALALGVIAAHVLDAEREDAREYRGAGDQWPPPTVPGGLR